MLFVFLTLVLMSESESDAELPAECIKTMGGPPALSRQHYVPSKSSASEDAAILPQRPGSDGRGHYDRSGGKGARLGWIPYVQRHMAAVNSGNLSLFLSNACSADCPHGGKCMESNKSI